MKIIIVGKAGSGKDHIRKMMEDKGMKYGLSCTSREPREGEVHMKDYIFIAKEKFELLIKHDELLQYCEFGGNYYGTLISTFKHNDVFIMSPEGLSKLKKEDRKECLVINVHCPKQIRIQRMTLREKDKISIDKIEKRLIEDEILFNNFEDYDLLVKN